MFIVSWAVFFIYPAAGLLAATVGLCRDGKAWRCYIPIISLFLAIAAYYYDPTPQQDLYRYLNQTSHYAGVSWQSFIDGWSFDLSVFLFFVISKIGSPHLLPAFVIFVTALTELYMICSYAELKGLAHGGRVRVIALAFSLMAFPYTVSVIRSSLAFTLFAFAVYREMIEKKRNLITLVLYLAPVFIHISALTFILLRLFLVFFERKKWIRAAMFTGLLLMSVFAGEFLGWLTAIPAVARGFAGSYINKAFNYVIVSDNLRSYVEYVRGNVYMSAVRVFHLFAILLMMFLNVRIIRNTEPKERHMRILWFILLCQGLVLGLIPLANPIYDRFYYFVTMLTFVLFFEYKPPIKLERRVTGFLAASAGIFGLANQILTAVMQSNVGNLIKSVLTTSILSLADF